MGDPGSSITNSAGRFHNITNAYIGGSARFPAIGSAKPSLTALAELVSPARLQGPAAPGGRSASNAFAGRADGPRDEVSAFAVADTKRGRGRVDHPWRRVRGAGRAVQKLWTSRPQLLTRLLTRPPGTTSTRASRPVDAGGGRPAPRVSRRRSPRPPSAGLAVLMAVPRSHAPPAPRLPSWAVRSTAGF
jgi:hypothetical protein